MFYLYIFLTYDGVVSNLREGSEPTPHLICRRGRPKEERAALGYDPGTSRAQQTDALPIELISRFH